MLRCGGGGAGGFGGGRWCRCETDDLENDTVHQRRPRRRSSLLRRQSNHQRGRHKSECENQSVRRRSFRRTFSSSDTRRQSRPRRRHSPHRFRPVRCRVAVVVRMGFFHRVRRVSGRRRPTRFRRRPNVTPRDGHKMKP